MRCFRKPATVELLAGQFVDDENFDVAAFLVEEAGLEAVESRAWG